MGRGKPFQRKCGAQEATANCTIGLPCVVDLMAFDEALMMPWQEVTVSELLIVPGSGCLGPPAGLWVDRSTPQAHPRFAINCEISCVTNAFASGKLQCDYGHFRHITTLPLEIVFSVPRCYRSCSFQCDGKQTHVMHGEFCKPSCPVDLAPNVNRIQCFDVNILPRSFECVKGCMDPPSINYAENLSACQGTPIGFLCRLKCQPGCVKHRGLHRLRRLPL